MADETNASGTAAPAGPSGSALPAAETAGAKTPTESVDIEKRFQDTRDAYRQSQSELAELKRTIAERDKRFEDQQTRLTEMSTRYERLASAFKPEDQQASTWSKDQVQSADELFKATPTYQAMLKERQTAEAQARAAQDQSREESVKAAGIELTQRYKIDEDKGKDFYTYLQQRPLVLHTLQTMVRSKEDALRTLDDAYRAFDYEDLSKRSTERGVETVNQKLDAAAQAAAVEKGSTATTAERALPTYRESGRDFTTYFGRVAASVREKGDYKED